MKRKELIGDAFYTCTFEDRTGGGRYVFQNIRPMDEQPYIINKSYGRGSLIWNKTTYTIATAQEITHLKACIKANTWVEIPKSEIINDYQIY